MTPAQLLAGVAEVAERWPDAGLVRNSVGNLMIVSEDKFVGYLDLLTGEVFS